MQALQSVSKRYPVPAYSKIAHWRGVQLTARTPAVRVSEAMHSALLQAKLPTSNGKTQDPRESAPAGCHTE